MSDLTYIPPEPTNQPLANVNSPDGFENNPLGAGALGLADSGTFGLARYLTHLAGNKAFENAEETNPTAYNVGNIAGNVGTAFIPGVGLAGKVAEGVGGAVKGLGLLKDIGVGAQKLGTTGSLLGMGARGAAEAGLNTAAHNAGNDANDESDRNQNIGGAMLTGGVVGGALGGLGKLAKGVSDAAQGASDASLGYVGVGSKQLLDRVKNPASNANDTTIMNKVVAVKDRTSKLLDEYGFFNKDKVQAANELNNDVRTQFQPFDEALKANPQAFTNGLYGNWKNQLGDLANSQWASQSTKIGDSLKPVLAAGAPILSLDPSVENSIFGQVAGRVQNGGNLFDVRALARNNAIASFKQFSRTQDPLDGLQWDAWNRMGRSIDDTVDNVASKSGNDSIKSVAQKYGDAQMISDGIAHQEAAAKLPGNSATFGRGALSALMTGRGNPIADFAAQIGGSFLEKATAGVGARVAHSAAGPLQGASGFLNKPEIAQFLNRAGSPSVSQFGAKVAPTLLNGQPSPVPSQDKAAQDGSPGLFSQDFGVRQSPIPANLSMNSPYGQNPDLEDASNAALEKLGLGQFATHGGLGGPGSPPPVNHYQGMVNGPAAQSVSTPSQPVNMAHIAMSAQGGNPQAQDQLKMAVATGLASQLAQDGSWTILHGAPTMDNPAFQRYLSNALTRLSDQNGNIQPDRAGQYIFTDEGDREQYQRGISAFRTIQQNIHPAMGSTGIGGMANEFTGGMLNQPAYVARNNLYGALEGYSGAEGTAGSEQTKKSIDSILNNPFTNDQSKAQAVYQLLEGKSPYLANKLFKQAGINLENMR